MAHRAVADARRADVGAVRDRWVGAWCGALLRTFGVRVIQQGDAPPAGRGHLVVANHRSTADILALLRAFGGRMVSRADLSGWPLVGAAARATGTIFVDWLRRGWPAPAPCVWIRTHLTAGSTVIVFPEGTTFPGDEVRPFHAGAFVAALRSGVDVVPVGLAYETGSGAAFVKETFPQHLARMAAAAPSRVAMCIGAPIPVDAGARGARLADRARGAVQELVTEARRVVDA